MLETGCRLTLKLASAREMEARTAAAVLLNAKPGNQR
jgi:hypothetical protein